MWAQDDWLVRILFRMRTSVLRSGSHLLMSIVWILQDKCPADICPWLDKFEHAIDWLEHFGQQSIESQTLSPRAHVDFRMLLLLRWRWRDNANDIIRYYRYSLLVLLLITTSSVRRPQILQLAGSINAKKTSPVKLPFSKAGPDNQCWFE